MGHDDGALIDACRNGDLDAARQLVRRRQREVVRIAYLLSGDNDRALELTTAAFAGLLGRPPEDLDDPARRIILDVVDRNHRHPTRSTWLQPRPSETYGVEDDRSRIKGALDRLEPEQRAIIALDQLAGLPDDTIRNAFDINSPRQFQETREVARSRIALAAGRADDAPILDLINRVLVEAPADDLWPEIEVLVRRTWSARRRKERMMTAGAAGGLLVLIAGTLIWLTGYQPLLGGDESTIGAEIPTAVTADAETQQTPTIAIASFAAAPTLPPPQQPAVAVEDLLLLRSIEGAGDSRSAINIYDPARNTSEPLLDAGESVLVSPDGKWIVSERSLPNGSGLSRISAGSLDGIATWVTELPSPSSWTVGSNRLYLLNRQDLDGRQIQVIDLETGQTINSWPVSGGNTMPSSLRWAMLVLSPDEVRLSLLTARTEPDGEGWFRTLTVYEPERGEVLDTFEEDGDEDPSNSFSIRSTRKMPDENAVYSIVEHENTSTVRLQFLDLDTGKISGLKLPIQARSLVVADRRGESEIHLVPSNTGAMLYVLQSRQRQVAVVDMRARSVIDVFPLTAGDIERGLFASNLDHVNFMEALLSPDGAWMYLAVNRERNLPLNNHQTQSPVWIVNTTTWDVTGHWMVSGMPRTMTMSGNGARLYLRTVAPAGNLSLTTLDTSTGEVVDRRDTLPGPEWAGAWQILSTTQIFHEQHGYRPQSGAIIPRDNPILSVLPGVLVQADGAVAGTEALITTSIVHPVTGEPATGDDTVRFDTNATIAIELTNGDRRTILVPTATGPGIYEGMVRLDRPGRWQATVTVINSDGSSWSVTQDAVIDVAGGLVADDGGAYRFNVRPANPVNRRTITLRVWMVESESGERLPEEIEFLDQISNDAEIILTHSSGERVREPLVRIDHSSFLGWVRFEEAGEWTAEIRFSLASGGRVDFAAGTIQINDLTEPFQRSNPGGGSASNNAGTRMGNPASR